MLTVNIFNELIEIVWKKRVEREERNKKKTLFKQSYQQDS